MVSKEKNVRKEKNQNKEIDWLIEKKERKKRKSEGLDIWPRDTANLYDYYLFFYITNNI